MLKKVKPFLVFQLPLSKSGFGNRVTPTLRQSTLDEWKTSPGSIYDIYKPVAVVGKYLGIVQLPSLYERIKVGTTETKSRRIFVDKIFPIISFLLQFFASFNVARLLVVCYTLGVKKGVDYITIVFVNVQILALGPTVAVFYFFRCSKRVVQFLVAHDAIETLLKPRKHRLLRFSRIGFLLTWVAMLLRSGCWMSRMRLHVIVFKVDLESWYFPNTVNLALTCFAVGLFIMATSECQPQFTYIVFQHAIKLAFDELIDQIKANNRRPMEAEAAASLVKHYRELHQHLCELSDQLDGLLSPIILHTYVVNAITGIAAIFFLTDQFNGQTTPNWGGIFALFVLSAVPMSFFTLISIFADATTVAAAEVLPALFSSLDLNSMEAKAEVELFALRVQCKKVAFSASGFFEINRGILTTIVGAMATYVIIMMQFKMSN